jgi:uncharacterized protein YgbK (DUF1537 family)
MALRPTFAFDRKLVVFDDDPTGSQTVWGCPLLLRWDADSLRQALAHPSPLLFLITNTRALAPAEARIRMEALCTTLAEVLEEQRQQGRPLDMQLISRGDSTLRGHCPLELEVLQQHFGPFAATFVVPAFLPGGRTTEGGVHRLQGQPLHETAFARDGLFGYRSSHLPSWLEERSGGRLRAASVPVLGLERLQAAWADPTGAGARSLDAWLAALAPGSLVAVDASRAEHLQAFVDALARRPDRRWLFQSAASLIDTLAQLGPQPLPPAGLAALRRRDGDGAPLPGLVVVGSHVPLADRQLAHLLAQPGCDGVELPVDRLRDPIGDPSGPIEAALAQSLGRSLDRGRTPVLYSSRGERLAGEGDARRALGQTLAGLMARLAGQLAPRLGYVISKGGITSHTLLAEGLDLAWVALQGQLSAGLSLVLVPDEPQLQAAGIAGLPVLTVPGNLGDDGTLTDSWRRLQAGR